MMTFVVPKTWPIIGGLSFICWTRFFRWHLWEAQYMSIQQPSQNIHQMRNWLSLWVKSNHDLTRKGNSCFGLRSTSSQEKQHDLFRAENGEGHTLVRDVFVTTTFVNTNPRDINILTIDSWCLEMGYLSLARRWCYLLVLKQAQKWQDQQIISQWQRKD